MSISLDDIQAAARQIKGSVIRTPCPLSRTLSEITGAQVVLKFENQQFTASFKERGALHRLLHLDARTRSQGVVAMSAGNHAQAVAYHGGRLAVPVTIVMPQHTPNVKVEHTRRFGAEVVLSGDDLTAAARVARKLAAERDLFLLHPYDDEQVIAGQGTVALEMLEEHPDLDVLLIPVGGGGLAAGCAVAAKALRPEIEVVGVEAERFPTVRQALRGEAIVCGRDTIAEGIAVKQPGAITLPLLRSLLEDVVLVDEDALEAAVLLLLEVEKTVVEGAGAAGLAALGASRDRFRGRKVGIVISGGNIDLAILTSIIERGLARSGRLVRLRVETDDRPGSLAAISQILAANEANVAEINHHRSFANVPVKSVEIEFVLQTRGERHLREITGALEKAGHATRVLDSPGS